MLWSFSNKTAPDVYKSRENVIIHTPDLVGTAAQTISRVDVYAKMDTSGAFTNKAFTAGDTTGPTIVTDSTHSFVEGQIVIVEGTRHNNGLYEIAGGAGSTVTLRGVGGDANVETFTRDQITSGNETGTITQVSVSVRRTSKAGVVEHTRGSTVPMVFGGLVQKNTLEEVSANVFAEVRKSFIGELGVPSSQGWVDTAVLPATISLVEEDVFGTTKTVVKHFDDGNKIPSSTISLTAQNWSDLMVFGGSFGGTSRLDTVNGSAGFFFGLEVSSADNPHAALLGSRRYGTFFTQASGKVHLKQSNTIDFETDMDGQGGNPNVLFDEWFTWECLIPPGLGTARFFINDVETTYTPSLRSDGSGTSRATVGSGSSLGVDRVAYHERIGVVICRETLISTKLITFTFSGISGGTAIVTHGLDLANIVSVDVSATASGILVGPQHITLANRTFGVSTDATSVSIVNSSGLDINIRGAVGKILIRYTPPFPSMLLPV